MALVLADRVLETCTSPGTGAASLLGATTGYQAFSAGIGNGNTCYYCIADQGGANWEVGIGTYSSSGNTLTRTTPISGSAATPVNFSSGTQNVFVTYPAEKSVNLDATGKIRADSNNYLDFGSAAPSKVAGRMWYNDTTGSWNLVMGGGNITQQVGEEQFIYGQASGAISGETTLQLIFKTGVDTGSGTLKFAPVTSGITDSGLMLGVATEDISANDFGRISTFGIIHGVDTTGSTYSETWANGDVIWYNPTTGGLTKTKPSAPNIKYQVGTVVVASSSGAFQVQLAAGSVLGGTDSNVQFGAVSSGNLIQYNGTYWTNVAASSVVGGAAGSNTQVQYNNSGALGASANFTFDGTNIGLAGGTANGVAYLNGSKELTTGSALTFDGTALNLGGTSKRITGDMSSATVSNRLAFQSSTTNAGTFVEVLPNGTSTSSMLYLENDSTVTNGSYAQLLVSSTEVSFRSGIRGTGTYLPMTFRTDGSEQMRLTSTGLGIGTSSPIAKLSNTGTAWAGGNATDGFVWRSTQNDWTATVLATPASGAGYGLRVHSLGTTASDTPLFVTAGATAGSNLMLLNGAGNLGLGVTPSAWGSSYKAFENNGIALMGAPSNMYSGWLLANAYFNGTNFIYKSTATASMYRQLGAEHSWWSAPSGTAGDAITFTQAMTLDASGSLCVATTSPYTTGGVTTKLTVAGSARFTGYVGLDAGTYLSVPVGENLAFNVNSSERMRITSAGGVSFGSSGTAYGTTGQVLTSNGNAPPSWANAPASLTGQTNDTSPYETSLGYAAGDVSTGVNDTFVGYQSGRINSTGRDNTALGYQTLYLNTTTSYCTAIGSQALLQATAASNTAVGFAAGSAISTGANNTIVGASAANALTTGANNIVIGYNAQPSAITVSNENTFGNSSTTSNRFWGDLKMGGSSAGTSGQVLTSAGAGVAPTWSSPSSAMTLVSTQIVSTAVSSISFTGLDSNYTYLITYANVASASNGRAIVVNFGYGAGPTYITSNYSGSYYYQGTYATVGSYSAQAYGAFCTNNVQTVSSANPCSGILYVEQASSADRVNFHGTGGSTFVSPYSGFVSISANALTAIKLALDSGNITAGTFSLYKIARA